MKITKEAFEEDLLQYEICTFYIGEKTFTMVKSSKSGKWEFYEEKTKVMDFDSYEQMMAAKVVYEKTLFELLGDGDYIYEFV